jgi:hypothetical protein
MQGVVATLAYSRHVNIYVKIMGPQSRGNPNCDNSWTPIWESRDKMPFGCGPRGEA